MIELLAITDDDTPPAPPLRAVRAGRLSVVCVPAGEEELTADALWRREALLEQLMADRDVLPVRFGTRVTDERAAADVVAGRSDALTAALERVRGAVELAVRVRAEEGAQADAASSSGREYLRAKVARDADARALHAELSAGARESVIQGGAELLRAAYLVDRDAVEAFVAGVRRLQQRHPELAVVCTGPWPPFSFTGDAR